MRKTKPQHHHQYQKFKKVVFWAVFLLLTSCLLPLAIWWLRGWNGREPVNFVIVTEERLYLLAIRPSQKQLIEIEIPASTLIKTDGGQWQAWALAGLSKIQKNSRPLASIGWDLLEIPVDSVVFFPSYPDLSIIRLLTSKSIFKTPASTIKLIRFADSLNENQIKKINLSTLSAVRKVVDPDGAEQLEIDLTQVSPQISLWFAIDEIRQEVLAVSIENASGETGAGNKLARALEHSGLNVVSVSNGQNKKSLFVSDKKFLKTLTVQKLSRWLNLKPQVRVFDNRADILIIQ